MENKLRMNRLVNHETNRSVIVALDHGFTYGPLSGLENVSETIQTLADLKPEAYVIHKGQITYIQNINLQGAGVIIQLTASSAICSNVVNKELVCEVEEALILGADGVAFQLNIGNEYDMQQVVRLGRVVRDCKHYNMPLLVMLYFTKNDVSTIWHGIRMCDELGVDFVKIPPVLSMESIDKIAKASHVRILMAGGEKSTSYKEYISWLSKSEADGVVIGRNIFQDENMKELLSYTYHTIHKMSV